MARETKRPRRSLIRIASEKSRFARQNIFSCDNLRKMEAVLATYHANFTSTVNPTLLIRGKTGNHSNTTKVMTSCTLNFVGFFNEKWEKHSFYKVLVHDIWRINQRKSGLVEGVKILFWELNSIFFQYPYGDDFFCERKSLQISLKKFGSCLKSHGVRALSWVGLAI